MGCASSNRGSEIQHWRENEQTSITHRPSNGVSFMLLWKKMPTMLRAALVLLLGVASSVQLASAFKPNLPPMKDTKVLVVGANGRIGEQVCATHHLLRFEYMARTLWSLGTSCAF